MGASGRSWLAPFFVGLGVFWASGLFGNARDEIQVRLEVVVKGPTPTLPAGVINFLPFSQGLEPIRVRVSSLRDLTVVVPRGTRWTARGEFPGFWFVPKEFSVEEKGTDISFELWPLGTLTGVVETKPKRASLPQKITLATLPPPQSLGRVPTPPGSIDCPVDPKGHWRCSLPAAVYDLEVRADGFAPFYLPKTQVRGGQESSVGVVRFEPGASIGGWVAVDGGKLDLQDGSVRLTRPLVVGARLDDFERQMSGQLVPVMPDGSFRARGLAPGTYLVTAEQKGFSTARVRVVAPEGRGVWLEEPLVLRREVDLALRIEPPLDWLERPWHVTVLRSERGGFAPNPFDGVSSKSGEVKIPRQPAGKYHVQVADSLGNVLVSRWHLDLSPSPQEAVVEVSLLDIEGRILRGGEPLAARLVFAGPGAAKVTLESDGKGRFQGVLPEPGPQGQGWTVAIESGGALAQKAYRLTRGPSTPTKIEIELPDTRVRGRVLDVDGKPAAGAVVWVDRGQEQEGPWFADDDGRFEVRSLPEGRNQISAFDRRDPASTSEKVSVEIREDREPEAIELRLGRTRKVAGRVVGPNGPINGAALAFFDGAGSGGRTSSASDGSFSVSLPRELTRATAVIAAPGYALTASAVDLSASPLLLNARTEAGDLRLALPELSIDRPFRVEIWQQALLLPLDSFVQWSLDHGESPTQFQGRTWHLPALAPGAYRVCLVPADGVTVSTCDDGTLAAGADLELKLEFP